MTTLRYASKTGFWLISLLVLGGCGGGSGGGSSEPPPDTAAPTLSAVQVPVGPLNRTVTVSVTASDNVGVTEVRFFVDDQLLGSATAAPYSVDWDTGAEAEGDHVLQAEAEDAAGNVAQSAELTVTVENMKQYAVTLGGNEENPAVDTEASAQADLSVNLASGAIEGTLTVTGLDATAAHIHDSFAGTNGPVLVPLDQDPADADQFAVPADAMLDAAGVDRLLAGALYVNVHTAAHPDGELRGQILPAGFVLRFVELSGDEEIPRVDTLATGRAAITLDQDSGAIVVQVRTSDLPDANQAHVHEAYAGANGAVLVALSQDPMDADRWFAEDSTLNAAGLDAFAAGRLYVNVHSPDNTAGEIRGQILPTGVTVLHATLSGLQEVPSVDTIAEGRAALTLHEANQELTIHVNTLRFDDASAAHLHSAYAGVNGPVEIGLTQDGSNPDHWFAEEQPLGAAQREALRDGATYVNVHSPAHPGGEIRGQVIPEGIVFAFNELTGEQELPPVSTAATGTAAVTVDPAAGTLVAHVNTSGADDAVAAHLHDGYAGTNGGIAIGLTQDMSNTSRWSAVDAPVDADQVAAISAGRYYANVHTPANPGGEIRAQVTPPPVEVVFSAMSGDQEVPAVASAASGISATTVNRETGALVIHLNADGADDASASHIHQGYAGQNGPVLVPLQQDALDAGHWSASGVMLDAAGLADYLDGRLYVNLHTPANPGGEIRGQVAPRDIRVVFSDMSGDQVVPAVTTTAAGRAATTANLATRGLVMFVNTTDADDATSAGVHEGAEGENGPEVLPLVQTPMQPEQWSAIEERLAADTFSAYRAGGIYVQVATPAEPDGEIRGQIVPPDAGDFDAE
ncbi:MAG: CHRD domain-containing protein, partial [Woeseia sp.]